MHTPSFPPPCGHYSPAVIHQGIVYVSGQLPVVEDGRPKSADIEIQTAECMQQMKNILEACGSDLSHLLKVNMYVSDIALWPRVNAEYARIMGEHRPARAIIPCGPLHYGCLIEIEGTAALIADTDRSDQYA